MSPYSGRKSVKAPFVGGKIKALSPGKKIKHSEKKKYSHFFIDRDKEKIQTKILLVEPTITIQRMSFLQLKKWTLACNVAYRHPLNQGLFWWRMARAEIYFVDMWSAKKKKKKKSYTLYTAWLFHMIYTDLMGVKNPWEMGRNPPIGEPE